MSSRSKCKQSKALFVRNCPCHLSGRVLYVHVWGVKTCVCSEKQFSDGPSSLDSSEVPACPEFFFFFLGASISLLPFLPFLSLPPPAPPPPPPPPPVFQFIFQFAPRSSQVCARRKFAEAAGAPSEATWRRDRRVTIGPSPPLLSLPLRLVSPPFPSPPLSLSLCLLWNQPARLHRSSG